MAAMMEQYSLRWNNFHSNLTHGFHSLLEASDMVDVTIAVDGSYLQAHKIVLSICSPYFKEMFKINPCRHPIVIIKDVAHRNMRDILEFMYLGEVNVLRENLPSFLRTAELLQVKGLTGDDASDTSSKKDEKMDSLPDTEEEDFSVSEPENQGYPIPEYLPSTVPSVQSEHKPVKRIKSSTNTNGKKSRSEPQLKTENVSNTESSINEMNMNDTSFNQESHNMKLEQTLPLGNYDMCDDSRGEEATGQGFDSSGPTKHENTINDQDILLYHVDEKGHAFCPYCQKEFVNRYNLKVHIRDKHDANSMNLDCVVCGKTMRNKSCLRVHMYHHRKQQSLRQQEQQQLYPTGDAAGEASDIKLL